MKAILMPIHQHIGKHNIAESLIHIFHWVCLVGFGMVMMLSLKIPHIRCTIWPHSRRLSVDGHQRRLGNAGLVIQRDWSRLQAPECFLVKESIEKVQ